MRKMKITKNKHRDPRAQIFQRNANKYKEQLIYIYDTWRRSKASKVATTLSKNFHFSSNFQRTTTRKRRKNPPRKTRALIDSVEDFPEKLTKKSTHTLTATTAPQVSYLAGMKSFRVGFYFSESFPWVFPGKNRTRVWGEARRRAK